MNISFILVGNYLRIKYPDIKLFTPGLIKENSSYQRDEQLNKTKMNTLTCPRRENWLYTKVENKTRN